MSGSTTYTEVETSNGRLRGLRAADVDEFRGIPFAAPPVGPLRFAAPQPPQPWAGTRDAFTPGPVAMQRKDAFHSLLGYAWDEMSEDCLYLDVFAPAERRAGGHPVMVWVHGGAFAGGSGSMPIYNGSQLARRKGVVVVCINYRVGIFGFLHHPSGQVGASGNQGLLDQVAALDWVQRDIASFGGDPANVTVFGESAGGVAVSTLVGFPPAQGLFQKAVIQSGNAALLTGVGAASQLSERLLGVLGLDGGDSGRLRELPADRLLQAQVEAVAAQQHERPTPLPFSPIVDGDVMKEHPLLVAPRPGTEIMAGTTRDEYGLFNLVDPAARSLEHERLVGRVRKRIAAVHPAGTAEEIVASYERARRERGESVDPPSLWVAIETDRQMRFPIATMLRSYGRSGTPAYGYVFDYESPFEGGLLGACHTLELPFIFGTYDLPAVAPFAGTGPAADLVANHVQQAWTSFATGGVPSRETGPWPVAGDDVQVVRIGTATAVEQKSDRPELATWAALQGSVAPTGLC